VDEPNDEPTLKADKTSGKQDPRSSQNRIPQSGTDSEPLDSYGSSRTNKQNIHSNGQTIPAATLQGIKPSAALVQIHSLVPLAPFFKSSVVVADTFSQSVCRRVENATQADKRLATNSCAGNRVCRNPCLDIL
jgi:hypothetical protein